MGNFIGIFHIIFFDVVRNLKDPLGYFFTVTETCQLYTQKNQNFIGNMMMWYVSPSEKQKFRWPSSKNLYIILWNLKYPLER